MPGKKRGKNNFLFRRRVICPNQTDFEERAVYAELLTQLCDDDKGSHLDGLERKEDDRMHEIILLFRRCMRVRERGRGRGEGEEEGVKKEYLLSQWLEAYGRRADTARNFRDGCLRILFIEAATH